MAIVSLWMVVSAGVIDWSALLEKDSGALPTSPDVDCLVERNSSGSEEGLQPRQ